MKKWNLYLGLILSLFIHESISAQCIVNASASRYDVTSCKNCTELSAYGAALGSTILEEDFNVNTIGTDFVSPQTVNYSNVCHLGIDGSPYLLMGKIGNLPRTIETINLDLTLGGVFMLDLLYLPIPQGICSGPSQSNEGVSIEYSIDNGLTWVTIHYFNPNSGPDSILTEWNTYSLPIPTGAQTANTKLRITQHNFSGLDNDLWGVDNILLTANDPNFNITSQHDNYSFGSIGGTNPNSICPLSDTSIVVIMTDGISTCSDTVNITYTSTSSPTIDTIISVSPSCGNANGSINIKTSGGISFSIDSGLTWVTPTFPLGSATFFNLSSGTYHIAVDNGNGCITRDKITILASLPPVISGIATNPSCGTSDGTLTFNVTGTEAVQYSIDSGFTFQNSPTFNNLYLGTYHMAIIDTGGCTFRESFTMNSSSSGPVINSITITNPSCNSVDGQIEIDAAGTLLEYSIDNGATFSSASTFTHLGSGTYQVMVRDNNGCETRDKVVLTSSSSLNAFAGQIDDTLNCSGKILLSVAGGTPPYDFIWTNGDTTSSPDSLCAGSYCTTVTDAIGCEQQYCFTIKRLPTDTVWPGDANNDGIANILDIFPIGFGYNTNGPIRANATINWQAEPADDWAGNSVLFGSNYKHADCNGDGTINAADTTAILQNYGLIHNKTGGGSKNGIPLSFSSLDTVSVSSLLQIAIELGNSTTPANDVYGIAFSIGFDANLIDSSSINFSVTNSWLGTEGTDLIKIQKNLYHNSMIDIGIIRTNHQNISGFGQIGTLQIIMEDDLAGKTDIYKDLNLSFSNVLLLDKDGIEIPVDAKNKTVVVTQKTTSIQNLVNQNSISIYPNPTKNILTIVSSQYALNGYELRNIQGQLIMDEAVNAFQYKQLDVNHLLPGVYFLKLETSAGNITKRVMISK